MEDGVLSRPRQGRRPDSWRPDSRHPGSWRSVAGWLALGLLLALLTVAAATSGGPEREGGWIGPEASYLAAAASLARDRDLRVGESELEGFAAGFGRPAGEVLLQTGADGPRRLAVPAPYALLLAPVVRWAPLRGPRVLNALLLVLAALAAARALERRLGRQAPWLVALLVFGSLAFRAVFAALPDALLLAAVVVGLSLARGAEGPPADRLPELYRPPDRGVRLPLRWLAVGALLAVPASHHPVYLLLAPAALALAPAAGRGRAAAALAAGVALVLLPQLLPAAGGGAIWGGAGSTAAAAAGPATETALAADPLAGGVRLAAWNFLYLLDGQNGGLLPFFFPLVLALGAASTGGGPGGRGPVDRPLLALGLAVAVAAAVLLLLFPFDLLGGVSGVGNRRFLPLYGALWLVPQRRLHPLWLAVAALWAAVFLWPVWAAPRSHPVAEERYRHPSPVARRLLPVEASQRLLPGGGERRRGDLWARSLSAAAVPAGSDRWRLGGDGADEFVVDLLVASPEPLATLELAFDRALAEAPELPGQRRSMVTSTGAVTRLSVSDPRPAARHALPIDPCVHSIYRLRLRLPAPAAGGPRFLTLTG